MRIIVAAVAAVIVAVTTAGCGSSPGFSTANRETAATSESAAAGTAASSASSGTTASPASGATGLEQASPYPPAGSNRASSGQRPQGSVPASLPSAAAGAAKLSINLRAADGARTTWTLTCDPTGGTHPNARAACGVLGANGAKALPQPPAGMMCTQQYGGPQEARIVGTWRGRTVSAQLDLRDGCQIARWNQLVGVLPPATM